MQRLRVYFRKGGEARFLSHLDLLATLEYAMRRARLPLALSEGFNPRPRMSLAAPLPLGHTGNREILELTLHEERLPDAVLAALASSLPRGIEVLSIEEIEVDSASAASRLRGAAYRIDLDQPIGDLPARLAELLGRSSLQIDEQRGGRPRRREVRHFIAAAGAPDGRTIRLLLRIEDGASVRPETILDLLSIRRDGAVFTRERIELAP